MATVIGILVAIQAATLISAIFLCMRAEEATQSLERIADRISELSRQIQDMNDAVE